MGIAIIYYWLVGGPIDRKGARGVKNYQKIKKIEFIANVC
jgi:hypothetical protein